MIKQLLCIVFVFVPICAFACDHTINKVFTRETIAHEMAIISKLQNGSEICFDSPGGSFISGVKLLRFLVESSKSFSTRVSANSECFSACAIAFMGGRGRSRSGKIKSKRVLEEGGRLGFHRPYITTSDAVTIRGQDAATLIERVIKINTDLILMAHPISDNSFRETENLTWPLERVFPAYPLQKMSDYGKEALFYVDTYEDAATFGISFERRPTSKKLPLERRIRDVCDFTDRVRLKGISRNFSDMLLQKFALDNSSIFYLEADYYRNEKLGLSVDPGCYVSIDDVLKTYTVWSDSLDEGVLFRRLVSPENLEAWDKYVIQFWQIGH